jgi:predicted DNA-binding ribbon-helix-helix protein
MPSATGLAEQNTINRQIIPVLGRYLVDGSRFLVGVALPPVKCSNDIVQGSGRSGTRAMKSAIVKRSVIIAGHKTSVSVEDAFWKELKAIAVERDMNMSELITSIDSDRQHSNLSSAIRLYVLNYFQSVLKSTETSRTQPIMHRGQRES